MGIIKDYLQKEKQMTEAVAARTERKITKYGDIRAEFEYWLLHKAYNTNNPLVISGYTAQTIHELAPFLDGLGVFNFMVTLRDDPAKAQEYIAGGFKRK